MTTTTARSRGLATHSAGTSRAVVVVPTYNESESLPVLLSAIADVRTSLPEGTTLDVLVVDDGSPDGTADLVRHHPAYGVWLGLLPRTAKDGLGAAYRAGFARALEDGYDLVVQMDADGSHPVSALPAMLAGLATHDLVIGSRYVRGGRTENWPLRRRVLSAGANTYARSVLWLRTKDSTAGFRAWRAAALDSAGVLRSSADGYGFQVENTWRSERAGLRVAEEPITFVERVAGASKMSPAVALEAVTLIARWRAGELRAWVRRYALVVGLVLLAGLVRLPFLHRPLTPDEAGFLTVAGQWHPGSSLYGDYWVDRPPLLVALYRIAALHGGTVSLRLLGLLVVMVSVALAAGLARQLTPRRLGPVAAAATALLLLDASLFGGMQVNGELLAVPFVLAGLCCLIRASRTCGSPLWWAGAGAAAMAAALVKQNVVDVFVVAGVVIAWQAVQRSRSHALAALAALVAGAAGVLGFVLGIAWLHGTSPAGIWDAVVTFRLQAAAVIATEASHHTAERAHVLALAWLWSGVPVLLAVAALRGARAGRAAGPPLGWMAVGLLGWEAFGVVAGGSYWLHYLIGTVPGTVLVVARGVARARRTPVVSYAAALAVVAASVALSTVHAVERGAHEPAGTAEVASWLAQHDRPGDTGLVAYGQSQILREAGLRSPYSHLWSLPVRVRDPRLEELRDVLSGPDRPTWVVTGRYGLTSWAIDPSLAAPVLRAGYVQVARIGEWRILHLRDGSGDRVTGLA
ncbi:polyprenol monophosphomannose synthase [Nocardioides jiangxiensis]|uniref:Polyprenol monophosphomannose synthase n=1 Tax=Nocardioides jiangxiensis TaxID=3064524 RepID=A0ABT9AZ43_9ACTN|nr:polyprenol monophosphomannose synthase [Nocardioides sp. WY-20]MDO7867223.1 polyprenol monophosphomannose synthase [Nocardioides sp. WY-20]